MIKVIDVEFMNGSLPIGVFLMETDEGPILFETGPHSTYPTLCKKLADLGYQPSDIKHVFLTHIHFDHAGAAWAFAEAGAKIYIHPIGAKHFVDPTRLVESARRIYKEMMDVLWGQLKAIPIEKMHIVEDEEEIKIGDTTIKTWFTPGHATHHIAWQIGDQLIAGDVAGMIIKEGVIVPPCPPPDINVEDWITSINLLRQLDLKAIYVTHIGLVTDIDVHLNTLEHNLTDWANWLLPHFKAGTDLKIVANQFKDHVAKQLSKAGMSDDEIQFFERANPPLTTVYGLMRYWKKKFEIKIE